MGAVFTILSCFECLAAVWANMLCSVLLLPGIPICLPANVGTEASGATALIVRQLTVAIEATSFFCLLNGYFLALAKRFHRINIQVQVFSDAGDRVTVSSPGYDDVSFSFSHRSHPNSPATFLHRICNRRRLYEDRYLLLSKRHSGLPGFLFRI
jgi:hypothetical protein